MNRRRPITVWLFLAPALAFYLAFFALPIAQSFYVSLYDWSTHSASPTRFVGLDNYARLLDDAVFWKALLHNFALVVLSLAIQLPIAIFLAALLSGRVVARGLFRTAFFAPMILPSVVIAIVWQQIYFPMDFQGLLVTALSALGLPYPKAGFLDDSSWALVAVIVTISWRYTGFHMILFMAGIESIPEELYEAARIDGAGSWQLFRHVTLPSLGPVIRISAVLSIVGSLKYFDLIYIMTKGGPPEHATELMTTWMYQVGIHEQRFGYGSALAVAGFVVSMVVVAAVMMVRRQRAAEVIP